MVSCVPRAYSSLQFSLRELTLKPIYYRVGESYHYGDVEIPRRLSERERERESEMERRAAKAHKARQSERRYCKITYLHEQLKVLVEEALYRTGVASDIESRFCFGDFRVERFELSLRGRVERELRSAESTL